jgi:hypothetical protein
MELRPDFIQDKIGEFFNLRVATVKGAKTRSGGAMILVYEAAEAVVAPDHTWLLCFSPGR